MLYVVHELVAPNRIFDHDLDIKSKITGERLTAKQYMKLEKDSGDEIGCKDNVR
jgi:hypothetical protein